MSLADDDLRFLRDLCEQHGISTGKVLALLEVVRQYELKNPRTGVYDALRDVLKTEYGDDNRS